MSEKKTTAAKVSASWRQKRTAIVKFANVILETAHEHGLCVRELEEACGLAISSCREAFVPTPEVLQKDLELRETRYTSL